MDYEAETIKQQISATYGCIAASQSRWAWASAVVSAVRLSAMHSAAAAALYGMWRYVSVVNLFGISRPPQRWNDLKLSSLI